MIAYVDLGPASVPGLAEKWRVVVRDTVLTKSAGELALRWYNGTGSGTLGAFGDNGMATLGLGFPVSHPVTSGAFFVIDVRFPSQTTIGLPLSEIVRQWQARLGGEVVRVARIAGSETAARAAEDRQVQLDAAIEAAPASTLATLGEVGGRALDVLQLMFWAVIIGGTVYLVTKARTLR